MDERLRQVARLANPGHGEAELRLLLERRRAGGLTEESLAVAAACGHEAAGALLGSSSPPPRVTCKGLGPHGPEVVARAALACGRALLPIWAQAFPDDHRLVQALAVAEGWLLYPGDDRRRALPDGIGEAEHDAARSQAAGYDSAPASCAVAIDYATAGVIHGKLGTEVVDGCAVRAWTASGLTRQAAEGQLASAIAAELIPWALGQRDPVRERVNGDGAAPGS